MSKMLSRFYGHSPNEYRVDAIILDHCNGFRNVCRNPSAFGHRDIFLEWQFSSCATTLSPQIRDRLYRKGSRMYFRHGTNTIDETLAIVKRQSRGGRDWCVGCSWHEISNVESSSLFSALFMHLAWKRYKCSYTLQSNLGETWIITNNVNLRNEQISLNCPKYLDKK